MDHSEQSARLTDLMRGRTVAGRYQVEGLIGRGGIGAVFAATQIGLDRKCALKVIRKDRRQDPVTAKRFLREARAAGRITSPHVVTLFDIGKDGEDLYIAMELLQGENLAERIGRDGPIPLTEALSIANAVARGLSAAHSAGVLHRDLKPANIFLCSDGLVKVLDFGIAKFIDDDIVDATEPLTQVNRILGTPVYMSPEAVSKRTLGTPADLYALGIILYEMVVGEPPFKTGNAMRTLKAHVKELAPPLAKAAPWLVIPPPLEALVGRLLEKDPLLRPSGAAEVADELVRILEAERGAVTEDHTIVDIGANVAELRARIRDDLEETDIWKSSENALAAVPEPATAPGRRQDDPDTTPGIDLPPTPTRTPSRQSSVSLPALAWIAVAAMTAVGVLGLVLLLRLLF